MRSVETVKEGEQARSVLRRTDLTLRVTSADGIGLRS